MNDTRHRLVSGRALDEDERIEASVRPKRFEDYIGQARVKENLAIAVQAARSRGEALDHVLLYGPPAVSYTHLDVYKRQGALRGHSFGNIFLTALTQVTGDFPEAVRLSGQVLAIRGRIFPSTESNVTLEAELENGNIIRGETKISRSRSRIRRVRLVPRRVKPLPEVLEAIREADLILIGPGSLYTSLIPNLLLSQVKEALVRSRATRVYIANRCV